MTGLSPLTDIVIQNKLTGENFNNWKGNLLIVLTFEGYEFVLTQPCPEQPATNASKKEKEPYEKWQRANDMAICYIMLSISDILRRIHERMQNASEMMASLEQMFGQVDTIKQYLHRTKDGFFVPNTKGKGKHLKKNNKVAAVIKNVATKKYGKPKSKCFKCGNKGHWKKDCPKLANNQGNQTTW